MIKAEFEMEKEFMRKKAEYGKAAEEIFNYIIDCWFEILWFYFHNLFPPLLNTLFSMNIIPKFLFKTISIDQTFE